MIQIQLIKAPEGFAPKVETRHERGAILQSFPGSPFSLNIDTLCGKAVAMCEETVIGKWNDLTIRMWSDILFTLQILEDGISLNS